MPTGAAVCATRRAATRRAATTNRGGRARGSRLFGYAPTVRISKAWKRSTKGSAVLQHPKTSKFRRAISLFTGLIAITGKPGDPDAIIFPTKATEQTLCATERMPIVRRALNLHDLRHLHASRLITRGVPLPCLQARLGHEKITTSVDVYGHLLSDAHDRIASVVAQIAVRATEIEP